MCAPWRAVRPPSPPVGAGTGKAIVCQKVVLLHHLEGCGIVLLSPARPCCLRRAGQAESLHF